MSTGLPAVVIDWAVGKRTVPGAVPPSSPSVLPVNVTGMRTSCERSDSRRWSVRVTIAHADTAQSRVPSFRETARVTSKVPPAPYVVVRLPS